MCCSTISFCLSLVRAYILINSVINNANKELVYLYRIVIVKDMKTMKTESSFSNEIVQPQIPHARMSSIRFLLLFLLILVAFCNQYAFNNPQALEQSMEEVLDISQAQFQLFYSLYALPNIFTLFFIGYLCDLIGTRISLTCLSAGIAIFQLLIAAGGYMNSYSVILVGRIFFGIFSQAIFIPHATLISKWFQGKQQAFALGIGITFPELGNAFNSFMSPLIFQQSKKLGDPLMFSFWLCIFGFLMACLAAYIDIRADRIDERNHVHIASEDEEEALKCEDVKKLRRQFWITVSICTMAMTLWIPFMDNVNRLFQKRFCYSQISAGNAITIPYIFAVILSVPLGLAVDKYGQRRHLSILGLVVFLSAQLIMLLYPQCDGEQEKGVIVGLILQGIGYAFYANVLVASIPLVCKLHLLGTAFGIMEMLQSLLQFLVPIVTGAVVSSSPTPELGYRLTSAIFACIGILGVLVGSSLFWGIDDHSKTKLDRSSSSSRLQVNPRTPLQPSNSSADEESLNKWLLQKVPDDNLGEKLVSIQIAKLTS